MKKFIQKGVAFIRSHALAFAVTLGLVGSSALAQENANTLPTGNASNIPTAVSDAVSALQQTAADYSAAAMPFVWKVGAVFLGITFIIAAIAIVRTFLKRK